ncbi:40S ribosomal protein S10 [Intoshia linei]|uniref:40S ribosomal protein S10 n=1 Tax=Intoshia linei TaxID=1819745 RepID=A0A177B2R5_9BILA|nr:40S ribosomal protein S10 [Intoshia linei]
MLIANIKREVVYRELFSEGVMIAHGTSRNARHFSKQVKENDVIKTEEVHVPNWQIIQLMRSLVSRQFVRKSFCWNTAYYFLTEKGASFLREYLHLPAGVIPNTFNKHDATEEAKKYTSSDVRLEKGKIEANEYVGGDNEMKVSDNIEISSGVLSGADGGDSIVLIDINLLTLGIKTDGGVMRKYISRNSVIPIKKT